MCLWTLFGVVLLVGNADKEHSSLLQVGGHTKKVSLQTNSLGTAHKDNPHRDCALPRYHSKAVDIADPWKKNVGLPVDIDYSDYLIRVAPKEGEPPVDFSDSVNLPENVQRVMRVLPKENFDYLFPRANFGAGPNIANATYSYNALLQAVWKFPYFCGEQEKDVDIEGVDLDDLCGLELTVVFAHSTQEVGEHDEGEQNGVEEWRQGLYHFKEMGCSVEGDGCEYTGSSCETGWPSQLYPCGDGQKYFGRGAKQISYNYNYGAFSKAMFGDATVLLNDPQKVITDGYLAVSSAIWFYMAPQPPKPSMHDVVTTRWKPSQGDINGLRLPGFGTTVMVINGGVECGGEAEMAQTVNRIQYFNAFVKYFKIEQLLVDLKWPTEDSKKGCIGMQQFGEDSSGAMLVNWAGPWWGPGGGCYLVDYVTGCSLLDTPQNAGLSYCECKVQDCAATGGDGGSTHWAKNYNVWETCECEQVDYEEGTYTSEGDCLEVECAKHYARAYTGTDDCVCEEATWDTGYSSKSACEEAECKEDEGTPTWWSRDYAGDACVCGEATWDTGFSSKAACEKAECSGEGR